MSYSLALGPFHPAWLGPQRFILRVAGDRVIDVEYQSGFNERGCAERLLRLPLPDALHLVARICGECSFAHSLAFCQALERLCNRTVGARAALIRTAAAELERASAHLRAAGAVLYAIGMDRHGARLETLSCQFRDMLAQVTGGRIPPPVCVPGGLLRDLSSSDRNDLLALLPGICADLYRFIDRLIDQRLLMARTCEVGVLPRIAAEQYGVRGPMARASGIHCDVRADQPYAAYPMLAFQPIVQEGGDVHARLLMLLLEAYESVKLVEAALQRLPDEDPVAGLPEDLPHGQASGMVEGPRGAIRYTIESDGLRLTRIEIDTPRQCDRLLARTLLSRAQLDDVMAIIASIAVCVACAEQ
ncbi:MAG: NADH-quinone oxidoreductase subunit D [Roseiflexus sp.]|nr:NADH-quinone oxidoreductase subunit D [Roseiflexus sp.]MCS7287945.1 NADH-quinone oxidoreductase subunit D [Roseiflexus sp.]MDW8148886.1 NADH-quinone oxidoreductase subunit D [Roseiflexaceae bacterium]MDW8233923.1 NADH-quinone oxidoreductase subunit D [Roseiflexaceae bacterium]